MKLTSKWSPGCITFPETVLNLHNFSMKAASMISCDGRLSLTQSVLIQGASCSSKVAYLLLKDRDSLTAAGGELSHLTTDMQLWSYMVLPGSTLTM